MDSKQARIVGALQKTSKLAGDILDMAENKFTMGVLPYSKERMYLVYKIAVQLDSLLKFLIPDLNKAVTEKLMRSTDSNSSIEENKSGDSGFVDKIKIGHDSKGDIDVSQEDLQALQKNNTFKATLTTLKEQLILCANGSLNSSLYTSQSGITSIITKQVGNTLSLLTANSQFNLSTLPFELISFTNELAKEGALHESLQEFEDARTRYNQALRVIEHLRPEIDEYNKRQDGYDSHLQEEIVD